MARRPTLGFGSLSPFGGAGTSFDAFNVAASMGEQAYLTFRRKEVEWEAGRISNDEYLAALQAYGNALPEGSEKFNAQNRYDETKARIARNTLIAAIESGTKEWDDLLAYDLARLGEVTNQSSTAYDERLGNVRETQNRIFNDGEDIQREKYADGKITAAQLSSWYQQQLDSDVTSDNPELDEAIGLRIDDLQDTIIGERDAKMVNDFNAGKVGYNEFVAYGNAARGRFAKGTPQYDDWTERLTDARDQAIEQSLTYRYGLSQRYQQLQKFVKDHGQAPKGSTSQTKGKKGKPQVVWTGSGWRTIMVGATGPGTTYHPPTANELKAWRELQVEVAAAKAEMKRIAGQVGSQPGGWVSTGDMIRYYSKIQGKYAKGSPEWYNVQERIDSLRQQLSAEKVMSQQGIKISYPKVKTEAPEYGRGEAPGNLPPGPDAGAAAKPAAAAPASAKQAARSASQASGDRQVGIDEFMKAIARVESGGRYDAVNKSSGARGKYQIMPANWSGWAAKYLGNANAAMTPANQEKVAKGKMLDLYKWLGDWRAVAHWWLTGGSNKDGHRNPATWSSSSKSYVNKVFAGLGLSPTQVSGSAYTAAGTGGGAVTPSGAAAGYAGGGGGAGARPATGGAAPKPKAQSAFKIPKGMDGRQFERFYQRFLDAYEAGEENFVDYSTGRAVNYHIPADLNDRTELVAFLDEARIGYFAERAKAYAGTASEEVAMTQYSDAIKKAGENQMLVLVTNQKPQTRELPSGARETIWTPASTPGGAAKQLNPVAEGLKLKAYTEKALRAAAAQADAAYKRGDDEMAYALIQNALALAAANDATLTAYYQSARGAIQQLKKTGAKVPEMVQTDLEALGAALDFDISDEEVSAGYAKSLAKLEEISGELEKFLAFDASDEPIRRAGTTDDEDRFQYKPGVSLYLKPDGSIEHKQTQFTGWTDPATASRDRDKYVTVSVKTGTSVKQVQAAWESATIGFIAGSNIPITGKLITGTIDGKEYAWVENPFAPGKWIRTTPDKPLTIKAPTGLTPFKNPDGSVSLEFTAGGGKGGGQKYRLQYDEDDGTYHVFQPPGFLQSEWTDLGSASSSSDLAGVYQQAGWGVDPSKFSGDDSYFFNSQGAWIGFNKSDHEQAVRNTKSSRTLPTAGTDVRPTGPYGTTGPTSISEAVKRGYKPPAPPLGYGSTAGPTSLSVAAAQRQADIEERTRANRPYGPGGATYGPGSAGYQAVTNKPPPVRDDWRLEGHSPTVTKRATVGTGPTSQSGYGPNVPSVRSGGAAAASTPPVRKAAPKRPGVDKGGAAPRPKAQHTAAASKARHTKPKPKPVVKKPVIKPVERPYYAGNQRGK